MTVTMRSPSRATEGTLAQQLGSVIRAAGVRLTFAITAMVCAVAAVACALTALWVVMLPLVGPAIAPLIVSAVLMSVAAGVWLMLARQRRKARIAVATSSATEDFLTAFNDNKLLFLLTAAAAGFTSAQRHGQPRQKR